MKDLNKPVVQLGYTMMRIHRRLRKNVQAVLEESDSSFKFEHMMTLRLTRMNGGQLSQSELLDQLPMFDRHRVSRLCAEIEELGLITRTPNPENRRENLLHLTPEGIDAIEGFMDLVSQTNSHIFDGMKNEDVLQMFDYLNRILHNLESQEHQ